MSRWGNASEKINVTAGQTSFTSSRLLLNCKICVIAPRSVTNNKSFFSVSPESWLSTLWNCSAWKWIFKRLTIYRWKALASLLPIIKAPLISLVSSNPCIIVGNHQSSLDLLGDAYLMLNETDPNAWWEGLNFVMQLVFRKCELSSQKQKIK